jgi:hypothetical protein
MTIAFSTTAKCPRCKHLQQDHQEHGGGPHYHGEQKRECSELHTYCMIPDCNCAGIVRTISKKDIDKRRPNDKTEILAERLQGHSSRR